MRRLSALFFAMLVMFPVTSTTATAQTMDLVIDRIINQSDAVRDGDKYVIETPPMGGTYARLTYTPANEKSIGSIELFVHSHHLTPNRKIVTCDSLTIDYGLLGLVGPRDGYVICSGSLESPSFSKRLALLKPASYRRFIEALALDALMNRSGDWIIMR